MLSYAADAASKLAVQWVFGQYFGAPIAPAFTLVLTKDGVTTSTALNPGDGYATANTYAGTGAAGATTGLGQYYTPLDIPATQVGTITLAIRACITGGTFPKCSVSNIVNVAACPGEDVDILNVLCRLNVQTMFSLSALFCSVPHCSDARWCLDWHSCPPGPSACRLWRNC